MRRSISSMISTILGIILMALGLYFFKTSLITKTYVEVLVYIALALGTVIFGQGMSNLMQRQVLNGDQEVSKDLEINKKDERNITIMNHSKAKAFDCMAFIILALILIFAWLNVDFKVLALLIFSYIFTLIYALIQRKKYERKL